jgi:hypothetical protein
MSYPPAPPPSPPPPSPPGVFAGTVTSYTTIGDSDGSLPFVATGGLTGPLDSGDIFGRSIASLGDLDGDGVTDEDRTQYPWSLPPVLTTVVSPINSSRSQTSRSEPPATTTAGTIEVRCTSFS